MVLMSSKIEDCDFIAFYNVLNSIDHELLKILILSILG